jgi:hypothetical protein
MNGMAGLSRGPVVPTRIRSICTGEEHTLAMTDHGTVYSWGDGKRGQLGHGDVSCQATPKVVDALKRKVAAVAAGSFHSVFLLAAGSVYVCGSGRQLGLGVFTGNGDQAAPQVTFGAAWPVNVPEHLGGCRAACEGTVQETCQSRRCSVWVHPRVNRGRRLVLLGHKQGCACFPCSRCDQPLCILSCGVVCSVNCAGPAWPR